MGSSGRQPFSDFGAKSHAMTAGLPTQLTPVHILGTSCAQRRFHLFTPCGRACELGNRSTLAWPLTCTNVIHPLWTENTFR